MVPIEEIARAALAEDAVELRALVHEFLRDTPRLVDCTRPETDDARVLAVAAGLLELFASRLNQPAPTWTRSIEAAPEPIFLVKAALRMPGVRRMAERESPEPLRRRRLYALADYLTFA